VIVITHDPNWVLDAHRLASLPTGTSSEEKQRDRTGKHLEYLMNTSLRGKVRLRLAGDIHNYQRHIPAPWAAAVTSNRSPATRAAGMPPVLIVSGGGGAFLHPTHCLGGETLTSVAGTGGTDYVRACAYPSGSVSHALTMQILSKFRRRNWRFDVIGGLLYLSLAHPLFTACETSHAGIATITKSSGSLQLVAAFLSDTVFNEIPYLLSSSTLSSTVFLGFVVVCIMSVDSGKVGVKFWFGTCHAVVHLFCAAAVNVAIEYCFALLSVHGNLGNDGLYLLWNKFSARFPSGAVSVDFVGSLTFGIVPAFLSISMLILDASNSQVVLRHQLCNASDVNSSWPSDAAPPPFSLYRLLYWALRSSWYWVLACPVMSGVVAIYLWVSVGYLGFHWNEGFSSLQHTGYKNFLRLKVRSDGNLDVYAIGIKKPTTRWVLDAKHKKDAMMAEAAARNGDFYPAHEWENPSRWKPQERRSVHRMLKRVGRGKKPPNAHPEVRVIDHCMIQR